jgi:hypothetical protein
MLPADSIHGGGFAGYRPQQNPNPRIHMLAWVHEGDDEQEEALVVHTGRMSRSKGKAAEVEPKNAWIDQNKLHKPTHADLEAAVPHKCR